MSENSGQKTDNTKWIIGLIVTIILGFSAIIFGGGWVYNEIWKKPYLSYAKLPGYDLGDQYFTGLIIENRGKIALTDVEIILTDLESDIDKLRMPGAHQSVTTLKGGEGFEELHLQMPKLSREGSLTIYIITKEPITMDEDSNLFIASTEVVGQKSSQETRVLTSSFWIAYSGLMLILLSAIIYIRIRRKKDY